MGRGRHLRRLDGWRKSKYSLNVQVCTYTHNCLSSSIFLTFVSLTMSLVTVVVHTIPPHSVNPAPDYNASNFSVLESGYGLTQPILSKHGELHLTRSCKIESPITRLSTFGYLMYVITQSRRCLSNTPLQVHICLEHAVGHLKGCSQSLYGLRQQILSEQSHLRALEWIRTCLVIHTLIHDIEQGDEVDVEWEEELIQQGLSSDSSSESDREDECVQAEVH